MKRNRAYDHYLGQFKWSATHHPTKMIKTRITDRNAFDAALKVLPPGWRAIVYALHSGDIHAVIVGPKHKMTITLDAATTIKRIAMDRCELEPDTAKGLAFSCDADAAGYAEQVRIFGRWTDRRLIRDEMQRLRVAVKVSQTAKDILMLAAMQRMAEHPAAGVFGDKGKSIAFPDFLLHEIGAYAEQALTLLDADERPQGGRPKPIRARQLIRGLAGTFSAFTGKKCTATPGTPFYEIARQVLQSLGLPGREPRKLIAAALADPTGDTDKVL